MISLEAESERLDEADGVQKKPEAALTSDVIERGKDWARAHLPIGDNAPPDLPVPQAASAAPAAASMARLLRANLSPEGSSFRSGAALFAVVYVIGFIAILAAMGLFPDLIQLMFGPQTPPPVK